MTNADWPEIQPPTGEVIARAARILLEGGLVAFPTETVYGLGGIAGDAQAIARLYDVKGRPSTNPLIIHVDDTEAAARVGCMDARAEALADEFWPGPLTLVLRLRPEADVCSLAVAGGSTVAVRVPAHPVARALIRAAGRPVAAPSANRSGHISPTTPNHVASELSGLIPLVLAAGRSRIGLESTVVALTGPQAVLLRPGLLTPDRLEWITGPLAFPGMDNSQGEPLLSPGLLVSHYAPRLPVRLNARSAAANEALLCFGPEFGVRGGAVRLNLSPTGDLEEAATNFFLMLRELDQPLLTGIAVMPIPDVGIGMALNDRLRRAAATRDPEAAP